MKGCQMSENEQRLDNVTESQEEGFVEDFSDLDIDFVEDFTDLEIKEEYISKEELRQDAEVQKYGKILSNSRLIIAIVSFLIFLFGAAGVVKFTYDALIETNYGETLGEFSVDKHATRSLFD